MIFRRDNTIWDLFTQREYTDALNEGFVSVKSNPGLDLVIYNYTQKAQITPGAFDNPAVMNSRGLIANKSGKIVARPFPKFFNYGDPVLGYLDLDEQVWVTDKYDGSLGILYPIGGAQYSIATRGSFGSDQASQATLIWLDKYQWRFTPNWMKWTYLFEIIYPENRIVVDYGDRRDLILLGLVNNRTGEVESPLVSDYPGPKAEHLPYSTLREALSAEPRPNAEGMVVHLRDTGRMLKIKQDDYVALHKIVTGLSERSVWEYLGEHDSLDGLLEDIPDEFHSWVRGVGSRLYQLLDYWYNRALDVYAETVGVIEARKDQREMRKEFALAVKDVRPELRPYMFALYDGKNIRPMIWNNLKPSGDTRVWNNNPEGESE